MSHFVVIVVSEHGENWEDQLVPYSENAEVSPYWEEISGWELDHVLGQLDGLEGTARQLVGQDELTAAVAIANQAAERDGEYRVTDGVIERLCTHNPDGKWDWHCMGGRWTGYFHAKKEALEEGQVRLGDRGVFGDPPKPGRIDQGRKCDIDFERARKEAEKEAEGLWLEWEAAFSEHGKPASFAHCREVLFPGDIDAARQHYGNQKAIQAVLKHGFFMECPVDIIGFDKEAYIEQQGFSALVPFAILDSDGWHERGRMIAFGLAVDEQDPAAWGKQVAKLFDDLPDDAILTAVDCHT
jgi:hypothetical protein